MRLHNVVVLVGFLLLWATASWRLLQADLLASLAMAAVLWVMLAALLVAGFAGASWCLTWLWTVPSPPTAVPKIVPSEWPYARRTRHAA